MKKMIKVVAQNGDEKEKEVTYIPVRFILAILLIILETLAVLGMVMLCAVYIPYFHLALYATQAFEPYFKDGISVENKGYMIPFGDGPLPLFKRRVAQTMIMNMLNQAQDYVYMMSPYLIIDNELCQTIENAALRGVDVRIITPHIPDKQLIFNTVCHLDL